MANESMISLNVNLGSTKNVTAEFDALIKVLESKKIKLDVDTTSLQASLKLASSEIEKSYSKIKDVVKKANEEMAKPSKTNKGGVSDLEKQITSAEKAISKFTETKNKQLNNILAGNSGTMVPNLTEYDTLVTKMNELKNIKLDSTNVDTYTKNVKEVQTAYDELTTKIRQVNSTSKEMNSSVKMDSDIVNKVRNYNTQLEVMRQKNADIINNPIYQQIANDVNKLSQANQPLRQLSNETNTIDNNMKQLRASMTQVGNMGNVFTRLGQSVKSAFSFMSVSMIFYQLASQIRDVPNEIRKLDTAFVDLKKTTSMSTEELDAFYKSSNEIAKQLGVTTEGIINQASAWSRLGYSTKEQAETMAQVSAIFSSISPEMNMDTATDGLVSAMKAFGISAEDALDGIASKINMIGNTQAVNNEDIVDFLTRSSSAMAEANNTLDETIALGTAAVEITRDAASVGNVLKTTSMRIRGYSEETEAYTEDVEVLSGTIADLTKTASTPGGISLFTDETKETYKSTYQILKEIDGIYDQLSDKTQAELLEALSGKRNGQAIAAILNNFEAVNSSMESMTNSQGNAMKEMEVIYDSIDYKLNKLKETWVGLVQNTLSRDSFKEFIDLGVEILEFIDSAGGIIPILTTILGLVIAIKAQSISATMGGMVKSLGNLAFAIQAVAGGAATLNEALAFLNLNPIVLGLSAITLALGGGVMAWNKYKSSVEEAKKVQLELANANIEEAKSIETLSKKYKEATGLDDDKEKKDALLSIQEELIDSYGIEAKNIDLVNGSYQEQIRLLDELRNSKLEASKVALNQNYSDTQQSLDDIVGKDFFTVRESLNPFENFSKQYEEAMKRTNEMFGKSVVSEDFNGWMHFDVENAEEYEQVLEQLLLNLQQQGVYDGARFNELTKQYNALTEAINNYETAKDNKFGNMYKTDSSQIAKELGIEDLSNMTTEELNKFKEAFNKILSDPNLTDNAYAKYCLEVIEKLSSVDDAANSTSGNVAKSLDEIASSFTTNLATVSENLGDIQSLYSTFQTSLKNNNGKFVPFDINDIEAIRENFGSLGDVFDDFETTLTSQASTSEDVQKAFDNLTGTYLVTSNVLDGLNTSNRDMVVSQLELQGVQNASQIVTKDLAVASEKLAQEGRVLSDVTSQEALQFINSANASDQAKKMLALYAIEKVNANGITLMTNGDIDNLISLISYLGGATTALYQYKAAKESLAAETKKGSVAGFHMLEHEEENMANAEANAQAEIQKAIEDARNSVSNNMTNLTAPTMSQNGTKSSSGSKSSEKYAEYIDSIYDSILNSLQEGTDKVDRQIAISQSKLENLELFGKQEDVTTANADLEKLYQDRIDIMKNSSGQMVSLRNKMAKELQSTGYDEIKGLDLTNISQLGVDKIIKNLEKQIDSANNASDSKLAASLAYKKNLIEDYTGNIINANSEINSMAKNIIDAQNELGNAVIDNIKRVTELDKQRYDDKLKLIELEQISLDEDSSDYKAKEQEKINMLIELQKGYQASITQLKAQGKTNDQEDVREYVNLYTDAEIEILNLKKSMAEKERQLQIKVSQDMVTALEKQKKALEDRTNLVMDMIKKEQELRKKAINEEIDGYEKIIEARKKSITDEQDDDDYNEELSDKQKVVTDLESKLLALQNDNSESSKAQRLKLEEELSTAKKDLNKLQLDKQTEDRINALDEELESFKDEKQEELDEIEDYLSKEGQIRSDAMKRIEQEGKSMYNSLKKYNSEYGSMAETELEELWTTATTSVNGYIDSNKSLLEIMKDITAEINRQTTLQGKLETDNWQTFVPDTNTSTSTGTSNNKNLDTIQKMKDNSMKWTSASKDEQKKLSEENQKLGKSIGAYYDSGTGTWFSDSTKKKRLFDTIGVYHSGGIAGKNMSTGNVSINPNTEIFSKLMIGEPITTQLQAGNFINKSLPTLMKAGGSNSEITININKLIDVDKLDANTDIESVAGRAVKEVMKQLKTNLSNIGLRPNLR